MSNSTRSHRTRAAMGLTYVLLAMIGCSGHESALPQELDRFVACVHASGYRIANLSAEVSDRYELQTKAGDIKYHGPGFSNAELALVTFSAWKADEPSPPMPVKVERVDKFRARDAPFEAMFEYRDGKWARIYFSRRPDPASLPRDDEAQQQVQNQIGSCFK